MKKLARLNQRPHSRTMPEQRRIRVYSNRGQGVFLVLYSLCELGGACAKQEVLRFIQDADLYEITRHDLPPYDNQNEPRYHTLLAWARKDALEMNWLVNTNERDAWQLSREGRNTLDRTAQRFSQNSLSVRMCYLWTQKFKKQIDPNYEPSSEDRVRPEEMTNLIDF
jgi:hypothetical protein